MNTADQFDGKIARYFEKARSLKEQRNSQIPLFSRIPSEILAIIFEFLAPVNPIKAFPSRFRPYLREAITILAKTLLVSAASRDACTGHAVNLGGVLRCLLAAMDGLRYHGAIEANIPDFHQDTTQVAAYPCDILALRLDSERFKDLDVAITTSRVNDSHARSSTVEESTGARHLTHIY